MQTNSQHRCSTRAIWVSLV